MQDLKLTPYRIKVLKNIVKTEIGFLKQYSPYGFSIVEKQKLKELNEILKELNKIKQDYKANKDFTNSMR